DVSEIIKKNGNARTGKDDEPGQEVEFEAFIFQGGKKGRADLHADRVDEKDKPELARDLKQLVIDGHLEVAEKKTRKKNAGHSQPDAPEGKASQRKPAGND